MSIKHFCDACKKAISDHRYFVLDDDEHVTLRINVNLMMDEASLKPIALTLHFKGNPDDEFCPNCITLILAEVITKITEEQEIPF